VEHLRLVRRHVHAGRAVRGAALARQAQVEDVVDRLVPPAGHERAVGQLLQHNWGVERGHHDVSVAIAEHALLPAVRAAEAAIMFADGLSCRLQLEKLAGRCGLHLVDLLARFLPRGASSSQG
jgi:hypothetical protein